MTNAPRAQVLLELIPHHAGIATVDASVGGLTVSLMLDTGASRTVFDTMTAERLGVALQHGTEPAFTLGGLTPNAPVLAGLTISIGDIVLRARSIPVVDLGFLNAPIIAAGSPPIAGVLGLDILLECDAVIDLAIGTLRLSQPSPENGSAAPPNEELKLSALASEAAGSLRSPAALLMARRSLTPAR